MVEDTAEPMTSREYKDKSKEMAIRCVQIGMTPLVGLSLCGVMQYQDKRVFGGGWEGRGPDWWDGMI